jgi:Immunity protein 27
MTQTLNHDEIELLGNWVVQGSSVIADDVSKRIEVLTKNSLKEVAVSDNGWKTLYIDPSDGRYWELTYPNSDSHGGGAPKLSVIPSEQGKGKI